MAMGVDNNFFKVYKLHTNVIQQSLLFLFLKGCVKQPNQSLKDYLQSPPNNMSNTEFKKIFNPDQRKTLDADHSGNSYDITLLSLSIVKACPGLTPELEELVRKMRKSRNSLLHENPKFDNITSLNKAQELLKMVEEMYIEIHKKYAVDVSNEIIQMKDDIDEIMKADLPVPDIKKYRKDLSKLRDELKEDFRVMGQEEIKNNHEFWTMTDPIAFISGRETLHIESVYTRVELVVDNLPDKNNNVPVKYEDLLNLLAGNNKSPNVLILEGPSGAGKTTLTKLLFSYWIKCLHVQGYVSPVIGLENFDFVFPFECSNSQISSYLSLIKNVLCQTADAFADDDVLRSVRQLKLLIMIDAADDLNTDSKKLLLEIIEKHIPNSRGNLRIICTTRPQALRDLQKLISTKITTVHTKITGISPENQEVFLECLHNEMKRNGQSTQETEGLVNFHRRSKVHLGDHFKYPLVLNLLSYLWAADPINVNRVTTVATLYQSIHELTEKRAHDHLYKDPKVISLSEVEESSDKFLNVLYEESLVVVCLGVMVFPDICVTNLKKAADPLPHEKLFSAFLNIDRRWTVKGLENQLTAPHKSLVEFFGACHVCDVITEKVKTDHQLALETKYQDVGVAECDKKKILEDMVNVKTVRGILEYNHSKVSIPLEIAKHQNLLVHTIGLLAGQGKEVLQRFAHEIIELLHETRIDDVNYWLHVINETYCDPEVAKLVAEKLTERQRGRWAINGRNARPASSLLKSVAPETVELELYEDLSSCSNNDISNLLNQISGLNCKLAFRDFHSYENLQKTSDVYLPLINRCNMTIFTGAVTSVQILPPTVQQLFLGLVKDDAGVVVDPGVNDGLVQHCKQLEWLDLHISEDTIMDTLSKMPDVKHTMLTLSGIDGQQQLQWAINTAQRLQATGGFFAIRLPGAKVTIDELCEWVVKMKDAGIIVTGGFCIPSHLYREDCAKLEKALRNTWNCGLWQYDL